MGKGTRHYTNKLISDMEEGLLDAEAIVIMCVNYMSESEVEDMLRINDCLPCEEEEPQEDV